MSSASLFNVSTWEYLDIGAPMAESALDDSTPQPALAEPAPSGVSEEEVAERVRQSLQRAQAEWQQKSLQEQAARDAKMLQELGSFGKQRVAYFAQLEREVVELAMAIARKVLQREAKLDPTLLYGLVRIALDRMNAEPPVRLRVPPTALPTWQRALEQTPSKPPLELIGDPQLGDGACLVETNLGTAEFGIENQLKEVEAAFADVLARRPESR